MFNAWGAATTLQTRDSIPNYNWLQPATCHLPPCTCHLQPAACSMASATCYRLHQFTCRTLFCFANQMSACWVHIWIKFEGGSVWEEWKSGAKGVAANVSDECHVQPDVRGSKKQLRHDMLKDAWVHFVANALQICIRVYPPCMCGSVCVCLSVCVRLHMATGSWRHMKCIEFPFYSMHLEANLCYAWCRLG